MLTNPVYGGAYAYGKTEHGTHYVEGIARKSARRKPREQWLALIPDTHEGYVSWERFERLQGTIHSNDTRTSAHHGAARAGAAILPGLLRCRRCASKLIVLYTGRCGDIARYACNRAWMDKGLPRCISFGGSRVDAVIAQQVLRVVQPAAINALNRNGLRTGRGNFWTRERVTALRSHHGIPVYCAERRNREGWLNLTQAARTIGVCARTLRLAVDHGELTAEHPLPDGPWIFNRAELQSDEAAKLVARVHARQRGPAVSNKEQGTLDLSMT